MTVYFSDATLELHQGDTAAVLSTMGAGSVDCVVTSPPYYGLRDYGGQPGQVGLEASPAEYVAALSKVFGEVHRVLAADGTLWLNLGDSYSGGARSTYHADSPTKSVRSQGHAEQRPVTGVPEKNLLGLPWRVAFALQDAGWYLRNAIVWHKPNAMPESVRDRLSNRYELVFLLTKSPHYWFDLDAIREQHRSEAAKRLAGTQPGGLSRKGKTMGIGVGDRTGGKTLGDHAAASHPLGRNPGDVWEIITRPFPEAHFATFPLDLPRRCILAGCKPGGTVLDPFAGAGTTLLAAQQLGRRAVGIELNPGYCAMALRRCQDAPLFIATDPGGGT